MIGESCIRDIRVFLQYPKDFGIDTVKVGQYMQLRSAK